MNSISIHSIADFHECEDKLNTWCIMWSPIEWCTTSDRCCLCAHAHWSEVTAVSYWSSSKLNSWRLFTGRKNGRSPGLWSQDCDWPSSPSWNTFLVASQSPKKSSKNRIDSESSVILLERDRPPEMWWFGALDARQVIYCRLSTVWHSEPRNRLPVGLSLKDFQEMIHQQFSESYQFSASLYRSIALGQSWNVPRKVVLSGGPKVFAPPPPAPSTEYNPI
jgi:hypothetical protein